MLTSWFGKKTASATVPQKKFDKKNILVVGGAGFIGSHLCDALVREHRVICLDNFLTGSEANIDHLLQNPNFEFVRHDIIQTLNLTEQGEREAGLEKFHIHWQGIQEVYYLASPTSENDVERYPVETLLANSVGLWNALELARQTKAKFLYASSDLVYGDFHDGDYRVHEQRHGVADPVGLRSHHVEAKRFGESLVTVEQRFHKLDIRIARIFNTYCPRMKLTDSRLIVDLFRRATANEPIIVYGGADVQGSYCFVSDIVKGLIKLMESHETAPVNLGNDQPVKLTDLAAKVVSLLKSSSSIEVTSEVPAGYVSQLIPTIEVAKERLDWFPVVLLDDGLARTLEDLKAGKGLIIDVTAMAPGAKV